jgi:hypothetical protein
MEADMTTNKGNKVFFTLIALFGSLVGLWATTTLISGLASVGWSPTEMFRQFLVATGNLGEYETMVDYYTHIKGVEYLIAVAFFVVFPVYYKSLKTKEVEAIV